MKNKLLYRIPIITSLVILVLGVFIIFYFPVIFQEGNPWPQIKGIAQLTFCNKDVVRLDIGENKYITKGDDLGTIKTFMKERGYNFIEQMGSGYFFKSDIGTSAIVVHRYYSRYYSLWSIAENLAPKDPTSAEEPQYITPDGRNFIDKTNSSWYVVLTNLNNCEVESVFQTHDKLVTIELKNGDKVTAYEPQIDDVMKVVERLGGKCGDIRLATE